MPDTRQCFGEQPGYGTRRSRRARAAQNQCRHVDRCVGLQRRLLLNQAPEVMPHMHGKMRELRLLIGGEARPAAGSAPIVDEGLHATGVVAAGDDMIDRRREGSDFLEQMRVSWLSILYAMDTAGLTQR